MKILTIVSGVMFFLQVSAGAVPASNIRFCGSTGNNLYQLLLSNGLKVIHYQRVEEALKAAVKGDALFIVADGYPQKTTPVSAAQLAAAATKALKVYLEYPSVVAGLMATDTPVNLQWERGVVTSSAFGPDLQPMRILGLNDCYILPTQESNPLIVMARVAGFDRAAYGIDDVKNYPLLFQKNHILISTTKLTNFTTGRYAPDDAWKKVWSYILFWMTGRKVEFSTWPSEVSPMYGCKEVLPLNAKINSIKKGVDWFYKGRFFVHQSWEAQWLKYQGDGTNPIGPAVAQDLPNGDGSLGLLEGHASKINYLGNQQYRYWLRADVQGEAAFALSSAARLLNNPAYNLAATNLISYVFRNSNLRGGPRDNQNSPVYGLIGWSVTHPFEYYGDDNARVILGVLGASSNIGTGQWDQKMAEAIIGNFRTTGVNGFRGNRLKESDLLKLGWEHFNKATTINPAPHFESWMWALYLWMYDKTGYEPFLEKTLKAIRLTMESYPDKWKWTNGIQQERARMVLPLAWLVRVKDIPEHRKWLDLLVQDLLRNQVPCGAIREELGAGNGKFGPATSNKEYGLREAPLIFSNGDPVADMLYTSNFAFFSLNEAAAATKNVQYAKAVNQLSDFLTRIQVKSTRHPDLDGAWFRAFEYNRWEYWGSNADAGWGAWGTLTGWTQSWIVVTQAMIIKNENFWDKTKTSGINKHFAAACKLMLKND